MDVTLLIATAILVAAGVVFIYDASYVRASQMRFTGRDAEFFLKRQVMWACVGMVAMFFAMHTPYWKWNRLSVAGLAASILLLFAVLTPLGMEINGAKRWLGWGPLRIQPAEFAKLALVLFFARWMAVNQRGVRRAPGFAFLAVVMGFTGGIIAIEPDLGTALALVATGTAMLFLGGARKKHLAVLVCLGIVAVIGLIFVEPYRMGRIRSWRDPFHDTQGDSYQIMHSLIALGSGGPLGVGLGQGRQKYFYLPAEYTDYIYGTIGEEKGLLGTLGILGLFLFVALRGLNIAHRTRDPFGSLLASGISCMIALQAALNIGVATNALPSTGVPLPFISYGGSSLVLTMIAMGLLINISQYPSGQARLREGKDTVDEDSVDRGWDRRARVSGHRYR